MTIATIRERLHEYIDFADDKKINAIYTIVEDEIVEELDLWEDKEFLQELKSRLDDIETGHDDSLTWNEVKVKAQAELKAKKIMSITVKFYRKAYREYFEAYEWYENESLGLGHRFEDAVEKLVEQIIEHPLHYPNKMYDAREIRLKDFPYLIIFKIHSARNIIYITSIFHTSRNPRKKYRR